MKRVRPNGRRSRARLPSLQGSPGIESKAYFWPYMTFIAGEVRQRNHLKDANANTSQHEKTIVMIRANDKSVSGKGGTTTNKKAACMPNFDGEAMPF